MYPLGFREDAVLPTAIASKVYILLYSCSKIYLCYNSENTSCVKVPASSLLASFCTRVSQQARTAAPHRASRREAPAGTPWASPQQKPPDSAPLSGPLALCPPCMLPRLSLKPNAGSSAEGSHLRNFKNVLRTESTVEKGQGTFSGQRATQ